MYSVDFPFDTHSYQLLSTCICTLINTLSCSSHFSRWNFTVGSLHLSLVEGIEDKFSCHTSALLPWKLQVDTVGGVLNAIDR